MANSGSAFVSGHFHTWRLWLQQLTALEGEILESTAQALSIAAPDGPLHVPCVDDCRCQDGVAASLSAMLYAELVDQGVYQLSDGDRAVKVLRHRITLDMVVGKRRPTLDVRALAQVGVIVSDRNGDVAHARRLFPMTWAEIEKASEKIRR